MEESESNMQDSPSKCSRMEGNKICSQTLDEFEKVKRGIERTKKKATYHRNSLEKYDRRQEFIK